jgi:hypothetical protein
MTLRIALLVCDTPIPSILEFAGDYHSIFNTLLCKAAPLCGDPKFILDSYDVVEHKQYPPAHIHYDAIIITGSRLSSTIHTD